MKTIEFIPDGVCADKITITIDHDIVKQVEFSGGCHGNSIAVSKLVSGLHIKEVIDKLMNIDCEGKGTSCADQLAKALQANS